MIAASNRDYELAIPLARYPGQRSTKCKWREFLISDYRYDLQSDDRLVDGRHETLFPPRWKASFAAAKWRRIFSGPCYLSLYHTINLSNVMTILLAFYDVRTHAAWCTTAAIWLICIGADNYILLTRVIIGTWAWMEAAGVECFEIYQDAILYANDELHRDESQPRIWFVDLIMTSLCSAPPLIPTVTPTQPHAGALKAAYEAREASASPHHLYRDSIFMNYLEITRTIQDALTMLPQIIIENAVYLRHARRNSCLPLAMPGHAGVDSRNRWWCTHTKMTVIWITLDFYF